MPPKTEQWRVFALNRGTFPCDIGCIGTIAERAAVRYCNSNRTTMTGNTVFFCGSTTVMNRLLTSTVCTEGQALVARQNCGAVPCEIFIQHVKQCTTPGDAAVSYAMLASRRQPWHLYAIEHLMVLYHTCCSWLLLSTIQIVTKTSQGSPS